MIYVNIFQNIQTQASVNTVESAGFCGVPPSKVQKHLCSWPMGQTPQRWTVTREGAPKSVWIDVSDLTRKSLVGPCIGLNVDQFIIRSVYNCQLQRKVDVSILDSIAVSVFVVILVEFDKY